MAKPARVGTVVAVAVALGLCLRGAGAGNSGLAADGDARIAFASARSGHRSIWTVRPDGNGLRRLTAPATPTRRCDCRFGEFDSHPAWSSGGRRIAFVRGARLYITIRLSDRRIVQLTQVPYAHTGDGEPRWSPDGRWIAFTRAEPRRSAVYAVRPDGRGERLITDDARGPVWAPDGRRLAFVEGVSGDGRPLTLSIAAIATGDVLTRTPLRRPADADGLGSQAWRR